MGQAAPQISAFAPTPVVPLPGEAPLTAPTCRIGIEGVALARPQP